MTIIETRPIDTVQSVHILGAGVTAKAVRDCLPDIGIQEADLDQADLVIASPGIPPSDYPNTTLEIISDIEFTYRLLRKKHPRVPILAVTGTNGKTTVTSLLCHLLDVPAFGNIGDPFISIFKEKRMPKYAVVEVSSYQLEQCPTFAPNVAIYLNLTPDHLDRHGSMSAYAVAKSHIYLHQTVADFLIISESFLAQQPELENAPARRLLVTDTNPWFSRLDTTQYIGRHNQENAVFALMAAGQVAVPVNVLQDRLKTYRFYPHRLESIGMVNGVRCINDSKATNPEATMVAIQAFDLPAHLILCGHDKGLDWEPLRQAIRQSTVKTVWVTGGISDRFFASLPQSDTTQYQAADSLEAAVDQSLSQAKKGDVLLFSPACSSFDHYRNFEHRGRVFSKYVRQLPGFQA